MTTKVCFTQDVAERVGNRMTGKKDPSAPPPVSFAKDEEVDFYELYRNDEEMKLQHGEDVDAAALVRARASAQHWINRGVAEPVVEDEPKRKAVPGRTPPPKAHEAAADYEAKHVDELHAIATERNLEGRAGLNKADLIKALEKDDKARAAKAAAPKTPGK